MIVYVC